MTSTNVDAVQNLNNSDTAVPYLHRAATAPSHSRLGPHNRYPTAPLNDDIDNQADSGHLSLENSTSPNDTRPSSEQPSPIRQQHVENHFSQDEQQAGDRNADGILKNNPFIVNGIQRAPNKVILEPIEQSLRDMAAGQNAYHSHVPKHLFAVKRQSVNEVD